MSLTYPWLEASPSCIALIRLCSRWETIRWFLLRLCCRWNFVVTLTRVAKRLWALAKGATPDSGGRGRPSPRGRLRIHPVLPQCPYSTFSLPTGERGNYCSFAQTFNFDFVGFSCAPSSEFFSTNEAPSLQPFTFGTESFRNYKPKVAKWKARHFPFV